MTDPDLDAYLGAMRWTESELRAIRRVIKKIQVPGQEPGSNDARIRTHNGTTTGARQSSHTEATSSWAQTVKGPLPHDVSTEVPPIDHH